jgi:colanic acid/amylovoran biosynthesis glycosyltransferase
VLDRFPSLHQTFVLREMLELERRGYSTVVFSLQPPAEPAHAETKMLNAPVIYAPKVSRIIGDLRLHFQQCAGQPSEYVRSAVSAVRTRQRIVLSGWLRAVALAPHIVALGIDHLHAHFAVGANVVAMYAAQLTDLTFSFTTHAVDLFARPVLLCESLSAARFAVTISEYNRGFLAETCGPELVKKVVVIRAGIDFQKFVLSKREVSAQPRILSVGRLVEKKGHRYLIEALAQLRDRGYDFECTIIGEGPEYSFVQRLIVEHCLDDRVELHGAATQDVIRQFYATSDIFVLPCVIARDGDRDGIPVSIMEAMAAGLPVISTTISGIPELVTDGAGLLVPPGQVDALMDAIARLVDDSELRRRLAEHGQQIVEHKFSVQRGGQQLTALFDGYAHPN